MHTNFDLNIMKTVAFILHTFKLLKTTVLFTYYIEYDYYISSLRNGKIKISSIAKIVR